MRFDTGITDIATAGTQVRISNTKDKVLWIEFKAPSANSGITYVGLSDVSSTNGYPLYASGGDDAKLILDFQRLGGTIEFSKIWIDAASSGDDVAWAVVLL